VDFRNPAQVAAGLNEMFPMEEHNGLMLTIWYFCYHLPSRELRYCAAGHHAAQLIAPGQPVPQPLWLRSPAIGFLPFGTWRIASTVIPPDAKLYIFSDGAFEIVTAQGRQWSIDDLRQAIMNNQAPELAEPQRLFKAVRAAARPGPLDDDFSVLHICFD
jgi:sigma-B regulation protein RsbU (phosphoserine phosphatase)